MKLKMEIVSLESDDRRTVEFEPSLVVCAKYTARLPIGEEMPISTLALAGNEPSADMPLYFPVSPYLLTNEDRIIVQGKHTAGEVEYVALKFENEIYMTVGSDHSDWMCESFSVAKSKQLCPKVIARQMILHRELRPHRDEIKLSSFIESGSRKAPYQSAYLADLMRLGSLIRYCPLNLDFNGAVLFSGTVPSIADRPVFSNHFFFQLELARFNFRILHDYAIETVPEAGPRAN